MQTPAGHVIDDGSADRRQTGWTVIFNPSFPYRLTHMLLASGITASFLVAGLSAWRLLQGAGRRVGAARRCASALRIAAVLVPLQIFVGDLHGLNTLEHQPAKIAAHGSDLEHRARRAADCCSRIPERGEAQQRLRDRDARSGASLILAHDADGELKGLDEFARPSAGAPVFFAFRVMVGMGVLMLRRWPGCGVWRARSERAAPRWLLWAFAGFTFSGWVATLAGWCVTEIGRQPWLVTGILRTADAVGRGERRRARREPHRLRRSPTRVLLLAYMVVLTHLAGERRVRT